jgi:hypothetical protein
MLPSGAFYTGLIIILKSNSPMRTKPTIEESTRQNLLAARVNLFKLQAKPPGKDLKRRLSAIRKVEARIQRLEKAIEKYSLPFFQA